MRRCLALAVVVVAVALAFTANAWTASPARAANACGSREIWINDLAYGTPGGGVYWDPLTSMVWTPARGWHSFAPSPRESCNPCG